LEKNNVSDQLISLGHKRLLPKDTLATLAVIEGRAHALVEANSFPFLNGLGHLLPNSKLAEVTEKLEELQQEFWTAKKAFLDKYASLRQSASRDWRKMADYLIGWSMGIWGAGVAALVVAVGHRGRPLVCDAHGDGPASSRWTARSNVRAARHRHRHHRRRDHRWLHYGVDKSGNLALRQFWF
jgi:hypothetical protein